MGISRAVAEAASKRIFFYKVVCVSSENPVVADGGTGVPYLCVSPLDTSVKDLVKDPRFSLSMSNAQLGDASKDFCREGERGDPENPPCARLTLSGNFVNVTGTPEWKVAKAALETAHPAFAGWGCFNEGTGGGGVGGHDFFLAKMNVTSAWLIDFYGGAAIMGAAEYFGVAGARA